MFLLIYSFVMIKNNIPIEFFVEAIKDENSGHFEEALIAYEKALKGFRKVGSQSILMIKIIEKLRLLKKVKEYKTVSFSKPASPVIKDAA